MLASHIPPWLLFAITTAWMLQKVVAGLFNVIYHPLASFPGPRAAALTSWYKTYQEVFLGRSWVDVLQELHGKYGKVVRVGPNELHFSNPAAYHEIYNNSNRWNKEAGLYRSFGGDRSSFGFLTYAESKQRKDIMAPLFSRRAIFELQNLVQSKVDQLCEVLESNNAAGTSSDLFFGLRCFTIGTITSFCSAKFVDALAEPGFTSPIIEAMSQECRGLYEGSEKDWCLAQHWFRGAGRHPIECTAPGKGNRRRRWPPGWTRLMFKMEV